MIISAYHMDTNINAMLKINELNDVNEIFIYGFGLAGKWLSANLGRPVRGFIDTDAKKVGKTFNKIPVYSVEQSKEILSNNSVIIVTVVDIQDVISIIERLPHKKWLSLGAYLNSTKVENNPLEESSEFIEYSLKAVEECHKGFLSTDKLFLRSVDLVITEKCSLKCKDCSNLMQYYEAPVNIEFDEIVSDFDRLIEGVDYLYEVRLIGGEPFMNKDIYKIIKHISDNEKVTKLVIYSNAMVPIREDQGEILKHPKVIFSLTDYGSLSKNTQRVVEFIKSIGAAYRLHPPENWTDSGTIHDFSRSIAEQKELFSECCGKNLLTVTDGKLYRCPFAANADRLKAIPRDELNSVSVTSSKESIRRYVFDIDYLPACNYCKGRSFGAPEIEPAIQTKFPLRYVKFIHS